MPLTGLTTPVWWLSLLQMTDLSRVCNRCVIEVFGGVFETGNQKYETRIYQCPVIRYTEVFPFINCLLTSKFTTVKTNYICLKTIICILTEKRNGVLQKC